MKFEDLVMSKDPVERQLSIPRWLYACDPALRVGSRGLASHVDYSQAVPHSSSQSFSTSLLSHSNSQSIILPIISLLPSPSCSSLPKMATQALFTVPILANPSSKDGHAGTVICTTSAPGVYLLTFTSPPDNRLLTPFCQALMLALDILEFSYPHGVVITTSGIQKFYSNGLDLEHASNTEGFFPNSLFALFKRLIR